MIGDNLVYVIDIVIEASEFYESEKKSRACIVMARKPRIDRFYG